MTSLTYHTEIHTQFRVTLCSYIQLTYVEKCPFLLDGPDRIQYYGISVAYVQCIMIIYIYIIILATLHW